MGHPRNAFEKFFRAVDCMATYDVPLRKRILDASSSFGVLPPAEIPNAMQTEFRDLTTRLRRHGSISTTLAAINDDEVLEIAKVIVQITERLVYATIDAARDERSQ